MNKFARVIRSKKAAVVALAVTASGAALADNPALAMITTAQGDAVAVAAALVAMGVAVWGAMYLYRKFFK